MDFDKHIDFWQDSADEDWKAAEDLLKTGNFRHALFFAHLTMEKLLKAKLVKKTGEAAPKIHNLARLAELAGLKASDEDAETMARMNEFQLEGRYPSSLPHAPTREQADDYYNSSKKVIQWLKLQS